MQQENQNSSESFPMIQNKCISKFPKINCSYQKLFSSSDESINNSYDSQVKKEALQEEKNQKNQKSYPVYYKFSKESHKYIQKAESNICHICQKELRDKYVVQYHLEHQHLVLPYSCKYPGCQKSYKVIRDLKTHIEDCHLQMSYKQKLRESLQSQQRKPLKRKPKQNIKQVKMDKKLGKNNSEPQSFCQKVKKDTQYMLYGIVYEILREDEGQIIVYMILSFIQYLQVLYFPFHKLLKTTWKQTDIVDVISDGLAGGMQWHIQTLRVLFILMNTILFQPILEVLYHILMCDYLGEEQTLKHLIYTDQKCFEGVHIVHSSLAVIMIGLTLLISISILKIFFQYKKSMTDPISKRNGNDQIIFILYQTYSLFLITFFSTNNYRNVYAILQLIGGFVFFYFNHNYLSFYNQNIAKIWKITSSVVLWTQFMFIFANYLENKIIEGTLIAWMIGIPIVIIIELFSKQNYQDLLLLNNQKMESDQQVIQQISTLQTLIEEMDKEKQYQILLDGYIEVHKSTCTDPQCAVFQQYSKENMRDTVKILNPQEEKMRILKGLLPQLYKYGLKRFPNSIDLRISFAYFLLNDRSQQQTALQEMQYAEMNNPCYTQQFIIYRQKKLVEDDISETQNLSTTQNMDTTTEINYQVQLKTLQNNIERCSLIHMEFWAQLSEENPDLKKLNELGVRVFSAIQQVDETWKKLLKSNSQSPKAFLLYGKYQLEVSNEKITGEEMLEKAVQLQNQNAKNRKLKIFTAIDEIYYESNPTIILTIEKERFAQVVAMNLASTNLFGIVKQDLLGRRINIIMPSIYSEDHDEILESIHKRYQKDQQFLNRERIIFGKDKQNHIFPLFIQIQPMLMNSLQQGLQFIGIFRQEKNFKRVSYIITDTEGEIREISSSCRSFLKIDQKQVKNRYQYIEDIIPNIMENKDKYMNKQGQMINLKTSSVSDTYASEIGEDVIELNLTIQGIIFKIINRTEYSGFIFKFEQPHYLAPQDQSKLMSKTDMDITMMNTKNNHTNASFMQMNFTYQFTFYPETSKVRGAYINIQDYLDDINNKSSNNQDYLMAEDKKKGQVVDLQVILPLQQIQNAKKKNKKSYMDTTPIEEENYQPISLQYAQNNQQSTNLFSANLESRQQLIMDENQKTQNNISQNNLTTTNALNIQTNNMLDTKNADNNNGTMSQRIKLAQNKNNQGGESKNTKMKKKNKQKVDKSKRRFRDESETQLFGKGIRTYRIVQNRIYDLYDIEGDSSDNDEDQFINNAIVNQQKNGVNDEEDDNYDMNDHQKTKKILNSVINDNSESKGITYLKRFSAIVLLILVAFSLVDYFYTVKYFDDNIEVVDQIILSNQIMTQFGIVLSRTKDLRMLNSGLYNIFFGEGSGYETPQDGVEFFVSEFKGVLEKSLDQILEIKANMTDYTIDLTDQHKELLQEKVITMKFSETTTDLYSLTDAISQMRSYSQELLGKQTSEYTINDPSIYFIEKNMFSDFYQGLIDNSNYYITLMTDQIDSQSVFFQIIVITTGAYLFLVIIAMFPFLKYVNKSREDVLKSFLDIPEKLVIKLYQRCENFISNLQQGENEEIDEINQIGDKQDKNDLDQIFRNRRRKKRFKNFSISEKDFFIVFIIGCLVVETYFFYNYISGQVLLNKFNNVINELNTTTMAQSFYIQEDNSIKHLLTDVDELQFGKDPVSVVKQNVEYLTQLDSQIHQEHAKNIGILPDYDKVFNEVFLNNICEIVTENPDVQETLSDCSSYADGVNTQGLSLTLSRYFEAFRNIEKEFQKINQDYEDNGVAIAIVFPYVMKTITEGGVTKEVPDTDHPTYVDNLKKNKFVSLLLSQIAFETRTLIDPYIRYSLNYLVQEFQNSISTLVDDFEVQRIGILIIYNALLICIFVILWLPYIARLSKNTWKTRMMLQMIPIDIISSIPSIKKFIRNYVKEHQQSKI